jgi:8-oxo-dGTP diphosphatase
MRRFDETPRADTRYKIRPGVYVILPRDGQILLTHQAEPEPELQLPGGGIDPGESPLQALHREVIEETGWRISDVRRLGAYRRFTYMPEYDLWAEKICLIYRAFPVRPLGPPSEAGHAPIWASPRVAAKELVNSGDRHFVNRFMINQGSGLV